MMTNKVKGNSIMEPTIEEIAENIKTGFDTFYDGIPTKGDLEKITFRFLKNQHPYLTLNTADEILFLVKTKVSQKMEIGESVV